MQIKCNIRTVSRQQIVEAASIAQYSHVTLRTDYRAECPVVSVVRLPQYPPPFGRANYR